MDEDVTEENIDEILLKSKAKTEEFNKELNKIEQRFNLDQISFTVMTRTENPCITLREKTINRDRNKRINLSKTSSR